MGHLPEMFILRPRHRVGLNNLYTGFDFGASLACIVTALKYIVADA